MKSIARILLAAAIAALVSSATVQATISPSDVSGLTLWFDAGFGVTTNGLGQVIQWNDRTDGSNNTLAENVVENGANPGPGYVASGIGGQPSLLFDGPGVPSGGNGSYTRLENLTQNPLASGSARTVFVIGDASTSNPLSVTDPGPLLTLRRSGPYFRVGLVGFAGDIYAYGDPASAARFAVNPLATVQSPFLVVYESAGAGTLLQAELNGDPEALIQAGTTSAESGSTGFTIGAVGLDPRTWNGLISEVIVYNRLLADAEINNVGLYLEEKYGIETSYVVPEPSTILLFAVGFAFIARKLRRP